MKVSKKTQLQIELAKASEQGPLFSFANFAQGESCDGDFVIHNDQSARDIAQRMIVKTHRQFLNVSAVQTRVLQFDHRRTTIDAVEKTRAEAKVNLVKTSEQCGSQIRVKHIIGQWARPPFKLRSLVSQKVRQTLYLETGCAKIAYQPQISIGDLGTKSLEPCAAA